MMKASFCGSPFLALRVVRYSFTKVSYYIGSVTFI